MQNQLDQISQLIDSTRQAEKDLLTASAKVIISSAKEGDNSDLLQLVGLLAESSLSAKDLILAIRENI
jgi:hypothetical protein